MEYAAMEFYNDTLTEDWFLKVKSQLDTQTHEFKEKIIIDTVLTNRVLPYFF